MILRHFYKRLDTGDSIVNYKNHGKFYCKTAKRPFMPLFFRR